MNDCLLDVSKALKCSVCGDFIISSKDIHKYNTCSRKCYMTKYLHDYYFRVLKNKRRIRYGWKPRGEKWVI